MPDQHFQWLFPCFLSSSFDPIDWIGFFSRPRIVYVDIGWLGRKVAAVVVDCRVDVGGGFLLLLFLSFRFAYLGFSFSSRSQSRFVLRLTGQKETSQGGRIGKLAEWMGKHSTKWWRWGTVTIQRDRSMNRFGWRGEKDCGGGGEIWGKNIKRTRCGRTGCCLKSKRKSS